MTVLLIVPMRPCCGADATMLAMTMSTALHAVLLTLAVRGQRAATHAVSSATEHEQHRHGQGSTSVMAAVLHS